MCARIVAKSLGAGSVESVPQRRLAGQMSPAQRLSQRKQEALYGAGEPGEASIPFQVAEKDGPPDDVAIRPIAIPVVGPPHHEVGTVVGPSRSTSGPDMPVESTSR